MKRKRQDVGPSLRHLVQERVRRRQDEQPCDVKSSTTTRRSPADAIAGKKPNTRPTRSGMRNVIAGLQGWVPTSFRVLGRFVTFRADTKS
jgi:hypothetical protein